MVRFVREPGIPRQTPCDRASPISLKYLGNGFMRLHQRTQVQTCSHHGHSKSRDLSVHVVVPEQTLVVFDADAIVALESLCLAGESVFLLDSAATVGD